MAPQLLHVWFLQRTLAGSQDPYGGSYHQCFQFQGDLMLSSEFPGYLWGAIRWRAPEDPRGLSWEHVILFNL